MKDKNGKEIKTGNVVMITGGYFKSDNGMFRVIHSPGDDDWYGKDYCLEKCNKNGSPSKSKYKTAFWPIMVTINDHFKKLEAKAHNTAHAEIEVISE